MADAVKLLRRLRAIAPDGSSCGAAPQPASAGSPTRGSLPCDAAREPLPSPDGAPAIVAPHGLALLCGIDRVLYAREAVALAGADALTQWAERVTAARGWVELRRRRLLCYGSAADGGGATAGALAPLPPWLGRLADDLVAVGAFPPERRPNHVLVNHYAPGDDGVRCEGILPHTDGPAYFPVTATLSLGAPALMRFADRRHDGRGDVPVATILLEPRSLVVFSGAAYTTLLHSIGEDAREAVGAFAPCVNCVEACIAPGDAVVRDAARLSFTFRHMWGAEGLSATALTT